MQSSLILQNQFGEQSNNLILGGTAQIQCKFIVDSANANGLGLKSLSGFGVKSVFMNSTASFTGTTHTGTASVTSISSTAGLVVGMPVQTTDLPDGTTIASIDSSTAITLSQNATTGHSGATITYQGVGSPNPQAGDILINFSEAFESFINGSYEFASPNSGSPIAVTSGVTAGHSYAISTVGTTSLSQWQKLGLPVGVTPAVGAAFIAPITTTATGTGYIEAPAAAGSACSKIEIVGDPSQTCNNANGGSMVLQCLAPTISMASYTPAGTNSSATPPVFTGTPAVLTGTAPLALSAPADGTEMFFAFNFVAIPGPRI